MKKNNLLFSTLCLVFMWTLISCKKHNVYDEMPAGKDLDMAYEKLLKQNKLVKDSTVSFLEIGSHFVIYPDNKTEYNQASVYVIVYQQANGLHRYIYNMTSDKFDSYAIGTADSLAVLFPHQLFPSFERLEVVRDSLLKEADITNPKIANLRFYLNPISRKPEIEAMVEDIEKPDNSKFCIMSIE